MVPNFIQQAGFSMRCRQTSRWIQSRGEREANVFVFLTVCSALLLILITGQTSALSLNWILWSLWKNAGADIQWISSKFSCPKQKNVSGSRFTHNRSLTRHPERESGCRAACRQKCQTWNGWIGRHYRHFSSQICLIVVGTKPSCQGKGHMIMVFLLILVNIGQS